MNFEKILIIRRDNIGDLVCTTPLIHAVRSSFPHARVDLLVNSYNAPLLNNHPDINNLYVYTKAKHRDKNESVATVYWRRIKLLLSMRKTKYDLVILANGGCMPRPVRWARQVGAHHVAGFVEPGNSLSKYIDFPVVKPNREMHEVEMIMELIKPIVSEPIAVPGLLLVAEPEMVQASRVLIGPIDNKKVIGLHISARKPSQQWPVERFIQLAHEVSQLENTHIILFWSPGSADNPFHPGDDEKAKKIIEKCHNISMTAMPTHHLGQLMGGLSVVDLLVCSDGGAMHVAAGLGKPIVCMFGDSNVTNWHPWGVPYESLQPASMNVVDLPVDVVMDAVNKLLSNTHIFPTEHV